MVRRNILANLRNDSVIRQENLPLAAAFAKNSHRALFKVHVFYADCSEFANANTGRE